MLLEKCCIRVHILAQNVKVRVCPYLRGSEVMSRISDCPNDLSWALGECYLSKQQTPSFHLCDGKISLAVLRAQHC